MENKFIKNAEIAIESIENLIAKSGSNLSFSEISEFAVAIHELKGFLKIVIENQQNQTIDRGTAKHTGTIYRKFIVVANDNFHYPMKRWVNDSHQFKQFGSKISHEISRILVNKYNFRKVINDQTNEVLHYQP
jgi:hypothetical protein